ncbi:hypothetical protein [Stenomitos frigidus]|uniref:hypothetical protein n=1 Tax=Stenomitos frigidus TaxID=1886765 RepID=UPI0015E73320|nr:hypothetical protein [Stenomitos frigidus]
MWSVMFYAPGGVRKTLDRFEQRGEAEAYRQKFERLVSSAFQIEVVFEEVSEPQAA